MPKNINHSCNFELLVFSISEQIRIISILDLSKIFQNSKGARLKSVNMFMHNLCKIEYQATIMIMGKGTELADDQCRCVTNWKELQAQHCKCAFAIVYISNDLSSF